mmetsp:Transcript_2564/g.4845  ORF Transcript_2564/g.4845 Transcript_2564/m.4845 type:complete len:246 (-) Transcript_2564:67-804(-)
MLLQESGKVIKRVFRQHFADFDEALCHGRNYVLHKVLSQSQGLQMLSLLFVLFNELHPFHVANLLCSRVSIARVTQGSYTHHFLCCRHLLLVSTPCQDFCCHLFLCGQVVEWSARFFHEDACALEHIIPVLARNGQVEHTKPAEVLKEVREAWFGIIKIGRGVVSHISFKVLNVVFLLSSFFPERPTKRWGSLCHDHKSRTDLLVHATDKLWRLLLGSLAFFAFFPSTLLFFLLLLFALFLFADH